MCVHIYVPDATGEMRSLGEEWVTKKDNTVWGRHGKILDCQRN